MDNVETKKIKLEVEIPSVIYTALIGNKMRNQDEIMERVRQGVVEVFYKMYNNPSLVPIPLKQYFEANYGKPPELHISNRRSKRKKEEEPSKVFNDKIDISTCSDLPTEHNN